MNTEPPSQPDRKSCSADATYAVGSELASSRTQMQHKCVELSLQITTALAAGVFALMFKSLETKSTDPSALNTPTKVCLVIVINLYTFLQLLLLTNYLFHTFLCLLNWIGPHALAQIHDETIKERVLQKSQTPPTLSQKTGAAFLSCFQPLIIYCSAFIGLLACIAFVCWLFPSVCSWPGWFFMITPIPLSLLLYILVRFHLNIDTLADCWYSVTANKEPNNKLPSLFLAWLMQTPCLSRKH